MKHIVDIENWVRKDNYKFFQGFANPWIAMTSEVECTEAYASAKSTGRSFFLYYLYAILRAANEIDEFRYRDDKNGNVVFHDQVDIITPIAVPGKTFYTVRIPYHKDFDTFYAEARRIVTSIPEDGDPYETDKRIAEEGDFDVILLSAIPKLYFTSITYTQYRIPCRPFHGLSADERRKSCKTGRKAGHADSLKRQPRLCGRFAHRFIL